MQLAAKPLKKTIFVCTSIEPKLKYFKDCAFSNISQFQCILVFEYEKVVFRYFNSDSIDT